MSVDRTIIGFKLAHAITEYDRQESKKRGYNIYALSHLLGRLHEVEADIARGADVRKAIVAGFCGARLLNRMLKAVGEPKVTDAELRGGIVYSPVTPAPRDTAIADCD